jgi:hypothetical protein
VDVEHFNLLSWFSKDESHEQDGERLFATRARVLARTASGDPAMAFAPFYGCARTPTPGMLLGNPTGAGL